MTSHRLSLVAILAATFIIANCGGPANFTLSAPNEPALPIFDKSQTASECSQEIVSATDLALTRTVAYKDSISKFLKDNCTSCHKSGGDRPDLSTYKSARAAAKLSLKSLDNDSMPPKNTVAAKDKAKFAAWVEGGMPESLTKSITATTKTSASSDDTTACTTPKKPAKKSISNQKTDDTVTANDGKKTIKSEDLPENGSGTAPSPGPSTTSAAITYKSTIKPYLDARCGACHGRAPVLTSYTSAKAAAAASVASMRSGNMPPGSKPAAADISNLQSWIDAGYPE